MIHEEYQGSDLFENLVLTLVFWVWSSALELAAGICPSGWELQEFIDAREVLTVGAGFREDEEE